MGDGLVDSVLGSTQKSGYNFTMSDVDAQTGSPATFACSAEPVTSSGVTATGTRSFGIATEGVIYQGGPGAVVAATGVLSGGAPLNN
jgi:hypothetical protein